MTAIPSRAHNTKRETISRLLAEAEKAFGAKGLEGARVDARPSWLLGILQTAGCSAVTADQVVCVKPWNAAMFNDPLAADHDPICFVGATQHECCNRVAAAGKTQFVELEQREIGRVAFCNFAKRIAADAGR